jgi:hypothetical protein
VLHQVDDADGDGFGAAPTPGTAPRRSCSGPPRARSSRRSGDQDDVPDPIDQPAEVHRAVIEDSAALLQVLLRRLAQELGGSGEAAASRGHDPGPQRATALDA